MAHAAAILGIEPLVAGEPVALGDVKLSPPRFESPACLGGLLTTAAHDRIFHTYGRAYLDLLRGFRGDFSAAPCAVAYPASEDEVAKVLAWAADATVAVVPYGGGTSVVGGVEASFRDRYAGVVSLDLRKMARVLEIDELSRTARIQAGAFGPALESQLGARDYSLRHYPQSFEFSTLGGWIATRAGGHFATLYTHVDDLVESMRVVTPLGVIETRRLPASGAGPSARPISPRLRGRARRHHRSVAPHPKTSSLARLRQRLLRRFLRGRERGTTHRAGRPFPVELSLARCARSFVERRSPTARRPFSFSPSNPPITRSARGSIARSPSRSLPAATLRAAHNIASREPAAPTAPASPGETRSSTGPICKARSSRSESSPTRSKRLCTWDRFERLHRAVTSALHSAMADVSLTEGSVTCRFSHVYPDGPAPYFTFLCKPKIAGAEADAWRAIKRAASDVLLAEGATITHHHAVGRTHRPWYDRERPDLFAAALTGAKRALDPSFIMNPGVLVDPPTDG